MPPLFLPTNQNNGLVLSYYSFSLPDQPLPSQFYDQSRDFCLQDGTPGGLVWTSPPDFRSETDLFNLLNNK